MHKFRFIVGFVVMAFALTSFAISTLPSIPKNKLHVPHIAQAVDYSCGAAALLSTLLYWGVYDDNESSLYQKLNTTPENGTSPKNLSAFANTLGLSAEWKENLTLYDLDEALKNGVTAIVDFQAWSSSIQNPNFNWSAEWESGHYAVLIASDAAFLYFMDPSAYKGYAYLPREEFLKRWHDYEHEAHGPRRFEHGAVFIKGSTPAISAPDALELIL